MCLHHFHFHQVFQFRQAHSVKLAIHSFTTRIWQFGSAWGLPRLRERPGQEEQLKGDAGAQQR